MATISIPKEGIELTGAFTTTDGTSTIQPTTPQALLLSIPEEILISMIKAARKEPEKMALNVGKPGHPKTMVVDGVLHRFVTVKPNEFFLQMLRPDPKAMEEKRKKDEANRITPFQWLLEIQKDNNLEESDPAVQALQQSLKEIEHKKQANTSIFVKDNSKLPPAKSGKQPTPKTSSVGFLKSHRAGLLDSRKAATQSMPASPSLGAILPKRTLQQEKTLKAEALKTALIHLLAVRPVSERFVCSILKCTSVELEYVLHKYGRPSRLDPSKFDLSDRGYKDLDVWKFDYKSHEDRQAAIDRAVKAYDRQRISREENVWQLLLPKRERGKGKILSKLSLHEGPMQRVRTPRINVEGTDEVKPSGEATGTDSDHRKGRLDPGVAESTPRSRSQDPIKKKRVSEKEAQTRRLLAKNPKKGIQATKNKENKPSAKEAKQGQPTSEASKVKSSEYVHDSDEDMEMENAFNAGNLLLSSAIESPHTVPPKSAEKRLPKTLAQSAPKSQDRSEIKKALPQEVLLQKTPVLASSTSKSSTSGSIHRYSDASQSSTSMIRTLSHKRTTSSPIKPSPLGSSPPANASDFDNDKGTANGSSSSTSPMMNSHHTSGDARGNKISQAINTDKVLKRKANDVDSDIHHHRAVSITNGQVHPAKRRRAVENTPPTSDSSGGPSPRVSTETLHTAQRFKKMYNKYLKYHHELAAMAEPLPQDKVEKLIKMRTCLAELKAEISEAVV